MSEIKDVRARIKRAWKEAAIAGRNLPLTVTGLFVLTCVEMFTAGGIIQSTTETVALFKWTVALAALEIGVSYGCGLLSFLGSGVVAELRADPRPDHRRRAGSARMVSTLLLVVPIIFFTNALALQTQRAERAAYVASEEYRGHQRMAADPTLDSVVQMEATRELARAAEVKTARMDATWFAALMASIFVYGTLGWAGTALYKPRPETAWEAKERQHQRKLAQDRERRAAFRRARDAEIRAMEKAGKAFDLMAHLRPN